MMMHDTANSRLSDHVTHYIAAFVLLFVVAEDQAAAQSADLALVARGFTSPVLLVESPDNTGRLFVVDQTGQIWILTENGTRLDEPFLNLADSLVELNPHYDERGLLGLAFHPGYSENGKFYVYYSRPLREEAIDNFSHTNRLAEFQVSPTNPDRAEPDSEKVLIEIDWPYMNHDGGMLAFGPDSLLYVSLGDGGNRDDQDTDLISGHVEDWYARNGGGNGQDIENNMLGSLLRIDIGKKAAEDHGEGEAYTVPEDNPFAEIEGVPSEQWAYGFRNPWRFSFDMGGDNDLIVADAGQNMFEEVSVVTRGGNYGWNVMEGAHCFNAAVPTTPFANCPQTVGEGHPREGDPLIGPVIELENSSHFEETGVGLVVVGGYVYRGSSVPSLDGLYFFAMWSRGEEERPGGEVHFPGRLLVATPQEDGLWPWSDFTVSNTDSFPHFILGFGQDLDGEVYVLTTDEVGPQGNTGRVYRIAESGSALSRVDRENAPELPSGLALDQNYPNPFNPATSIRFRLGLPQHVTLSIYDATGRKLRTLISEAVTAGIHEVAWDGRDAVGRSVPSGIYFYRAFTDSENVTRAMTLLK